MTISSSDPRVAKLIRETRAQAIAAGYEDSLWGVVVILATALVGLEDEAAAGRHPRGKASGAVG